MRAVSSFIRLISFGFLFFLILNKAFAVELRGSATERYDGVYTKQKALAAIDIAKTKACTNAFNKFTVPITFVKTNLLGYFIELSTCDSAAKCMTLLILYFKKTSLILAEFEISALINL